MAILEETRRWRPRRCSLQAEWWTDLDGRSVHSVIHGWADENPAACPSRWLVKELSKLVSAAQPRER